MTGRLRGTTIAVLAMLLSMAAVGPASATGTDFTLSPASGPVGTTVTIDAAGTTAFPTSTDPTPVVPVVDFGGVASSSVTTVSSTELTAVVPPAAVTGPVTVTVGTTTYSGPSFTIPAVVTPETPVWAVTVSRPSVGYGASTKLTGVLTGTSGPVAGATARLQQSSGSGGWRPVPVTTSATTNASGTVHWIVTPSQNEQYRISSSAIGNYLAALSDPTPVQVQPKLVLHPLAVASIGVASQLTGTVRPAIAGTIELQRLNGSTWRTVGQANARRGSFAFSFTPRTIGVERYRLVEDATTLHLSGMSSTVQIDVTRGELRYGSTGLEVHALQRQLRRLHYDVGPPSSTYGWDMVHAVTAFEKVQGITRDGVAGNQTWKRLGNPKVPHLQHADPSAPVAVEINLTKQILMIAKHGKIWRILDTSTAGGYTYTDSAGLQATAVTPTGRFTIQYKIDHLVTDKLGTLWRPSYFDYSGDAIHGEGDTNGGSNVPPYAASHGCVRITDLAVDRYYNTFAIGTPVWIYY